MDEITLVSQCICANISLEHKPIERHKYSHMGALIVDSILQAGLSYDHIVLPRVNRILSLYSHFVTSLDFFILIHTYDIKQMIQMNSDTKATRIFRLTKLLVEENVMSVEDLSRWIQSESNKMKLRLISGIGSKTIDYMSILCGNDDIAIDRHLFAFLEYAGCRKKTYNESKEIYQLASRQLNISLSFLDEGIWKFMRAKGLPSA